MTTAQAQEYFDILQDKYGSPNVEPSEIIDFLNNGVNEYLNRVVPDNQGGIVNYEDDKNVVANVQPLIYPVLITTTSGGLATNTVINTALTTAVGLTSEYFRVMSARITSNDLPVKYVRQANIGSFQSNYFKRSSTTEPTFTLLAAGLQFYPKSTTSATVTVLKKPRVLSDVVDPEWPDYQMYNIIMIALQLAGVSTRDEEIIRDIRNITAQAK